MKISDEVLAVLSDCTIDGNVLKLGPRQLDRGLYVSTNKVIEAIGGKWSRKEKGHVFDGDPSEKFDLVLLTGEVKPPQKFGYFPTPPALARLVVEMADLEPGMKVLEPSAGCGSLALEAAKIVGRDNVVCVELLEDNRRALTDLGFRVSVNEDFIKIPPEPVFDRVIMNPPFEKQQDIDHVLHAMDFLVSGGKLVSIMSAGVKFRENAKTVGFRALLNACGMYCDNPDGSFKVSGTMVNTITVIMRHA